MKSAALLAGTVVLLAGCTTIQVQPLEATAAPRTPVCIVDNPKVIVRDFVPVLQQGFARHGLATRLITERGVSRCDMILRYTALRNWDMAPYLVDAQLDLYRGSQQIATANYHLVGKGGLALTKWQGVETKMTPVIDQLLAAYPVGTPVAYESAIDPAANEPAMAEAPPPGGKSADPVARLKDAQELREKGVISEQEFQGLKSQILGTSQPVAPAKVAAQPES